MSRTGWLVVFVLTLATPVAAQEPAPLKETTVGMPGRLEGVVVPGPELEAKPIEDRKKPVVLRVIKTYPHGTDFRYDLEYYGLDPGTHDLRDYLRRKDGQPLSNVKPLPVKVNPVRPPGQVKPNDLEIDKAPRMGGYRWVMIGFIVFWGLGFLGIVAWMLSPLFRSKRAVASVHRVSLADRLRPLVEGAIAGKLSQAELAGLERSLLAFWRKRLNLEATEPAAAIATMRAHKEAGPLLGQLEEWLHKPGRQAPVDVPTLLAPYRDLPPDAVEL